MKYNIGHYYGRCPPVPEAVKIVEATEKYAAAYEIDIDDLHEFTKKYGPIILSPPGHRPGRHIADAWFIWVTDSTGKFTQK